MLSIIIKIVIIIRILIVFITIFTGTMLLQYVYCMYQKLQNFDIHRHRGSSSTIILFSSSIFPLTKGPVMRSLDVQLLASASCWTDSQVASDLRYHGVHRMLLNEFRGHGHLVGYCWDPLILRMPVREPTGSAKVGAEGGYFLPTRGPQMTPPGPGEPLLGARCHNGQEGICLREPHAPLKQTKIC